MINTAGPDINKIRADFPLISGTDLAYLDNAATSQKPACVLETEKEFYERYNANPFRGLYDLAEEATGRYEAARETVRRFIGAKSTREIVFTRNATEGLNLAAYSLSDILLKEGDEIVVSIMEHHSNLLPWQHAAKRKGAVLRYLECGADGSINMEDFLSMLSDKTRLVALTQVSNVLGVKNDIKAFAAACHERGIVLVADGAQSVPHMPVDVVDLDVDFLSFSGHKMLGPMGIGVLYGKEEWLEKMPPFLTGGEMIDSVSREGAVYAQLPHKFEAGTVNAGAAVAFARAIEYIDDIGFDYIEERENMLTARLMGKLKEIPHVSILGDPDPVNHHGIVTFTVEGVHPHDIAAILGADRVAIRAGHHCAQPLHQHLGIWSSTRASLAFYNTEEEVDRFIGSVSTIRGKMGYGE